MKNYYIKDIINAYFKTKASTLSQFLFWKWYSNKENRSEKEAVLEKIWETTPSLITEETMEDLSKINTLISRNKTHHRLHNHILIRVISYAAIIVLIIASTLYINNHLNNSIEMDFVESYVSHGQCKSVTLDDGTIVKLNAGSTFIYPKKFLSDTRTVYLIGQANFEVAKNAKKPFIVKTKHMAITAIGTKFIVESYPDTYFTKTTLVEGCIKVNMETNKNKSYVLKPDKQLIFSHKEHKVRIIDVDAAKLASWEKGYLIFQGATFDEIASALEKKYNITINYNTNKMNQNSYYVKFYPNEPTKEVLKVLSMLVPKSSYKIDGSTVYYYFQ